MGIDLIEQASCRRHTMWGGADDARRRSAGHGAGARVREATRLGEEGPLGARVREGRVVRGQTAAMVATTAATTCGPVTSLWCLIQASAFRLKTFACERVRSSPAMRECERIGEPDGLVVLRVGDDDRPGHTFVREDGVELPVVPPRPAPSSDSTS